MVDALSNGVEMVNEEDDKLNEKSGGVGAIVPLESEQDEDEATLQRPPTSREAERASLQRIFVRAAWISLSMAFVITFVRTSPCLYQLSGSI
jgi:hypothetical protein